MPISAEFTDRVVAALSNARPIRHRKMFGGLGFYSNDIFFAIGDDDRLFFKADDQTRSKYEAYGMGPWICGGDVVDAHREVPSEILDSADLGDWIDEAAAAAVRMKKKK